MRFGLRLALLAGAAAVLLGAATLLDAPRRTDAPAVAILADGRLDGVPASRELAGARMLASLEGALALDAAEAPILVVDEGAVRALPDGALRQVLDRAIAVFGVDVPLGELWRVTGTLAEMRSVDASFAEEELRLVAVEFAGPFYSYNWRCRADGEAQGGSGQAEVSRGHFQEQLRRFLRGAGRCPLE